MPLSIPSAHVLSHLIGTVPVDMICTCNSRDNRSEAAEHRKDYVVRAVQPRSKPPKHGACVVVTVGKPPGLYLSVEEGRAKVKGVSKAVWQSYSTASAGAEAWRFAQERGLVGTVDGLLPRRVHLRPLDHDGPIPAQTPLSDTPPTYYVVYRGRLPGIYDSR